jgi:hypothetical protein
MTTIGELEEKKAPAETANDKLQKSCVAALSRIVADKSGRFGGIVNDITVIGFHGWVMITTATKKLAWSYTIGLSWRLAKQPDIIVVHDVDSDMRSIVAALAKHVDNGAHNLEAYTDRPDTYLYDPTNVCSAKLRFRSIPDQTDLLSDFCFRAGAVAQALNLVAPRYVQCLWPNSSGAYPTATAPLSYQPLLR